MIVGRLGDQRGQTAAEYMGLLLVVGAIIAAIAASGIGALVTAGIERAICVSVGDGPCPTVAAQLAQDRGGDDEDQAREEAERERRELERARTEFKDVHAQSMGAVAGSMRPLSEVQGQSPGDWVLGGLGELSGVNDADRGVTKLGEGDIAGGAFSLAMAWPGAKAFKLGKEGIEEGVEQITREGGQQAAKGADDLARRVPRYAGGKTQGALEVGGRQVDLISGRAGPAASIPKGTPGFDAYVRTHVEGHAAAILRQQGGGRARLAINQVPCPNCDRNLPRALPEGAELEVIGPGGFRRTYRGLSD